MPDRAGRPGERAAGGIPHREAAVAADGGGSRAGRTARHGERILVCSAHPGEGKTFAR
jgi:hypothetical protein